MSNFLPEELNKHHNLDKFFTPAVSDFFEDVKAIYSKNIEYQEHKIFEQMIIPDRIINFKIIWENDHGDLEVNQGWRVQHSNILGAYKGGLRFHTSVNENILRQLAFEQTLKGSITEMGLGGAKGGSNFNPKGKTKNEIKRFCHAFMDELYHYIGSDTDVPAGDLGVGTYEIACLYARYVKLTHRASGVLTGKAPNFGGSCGRKEATGHGAIYFIEEFLNHFGKSLKDANILISGSGNVALYAAQKAQKHHAKVLTLSDTSGVLYFRNGINEGHLENVIQYKSEHKSLCEWFNDQKSSPNIQFSSEKNLWEIQADIALPCAIENEIDEISAKNLVENNCQIIAEGSNLPLTRKARAIIHDSKITHLIGNLVNSGGIAVSNYERTQNATYQAWTCKKVDNLLNKYMHSLAKNVINKAQEIGCDNNYRKAANVLAFTRLADGMLYK